MISARTLWWTAAIPCSEQALESGKDHLHLFIRFQGQCHEIFASGFFHESSFPKRLKITLGSFHIFRKCASQGAPPVSTTPVVHLELRISPRIFEIIRNGAALLGYSGARGKLIHEKT